MKPITLLAKTLLLLAVTSYSWAASTTGTANTSGTTGSTAKTGPTGDSFSPTEIGGENFFPMKLGGTLRFSSGDPVPSNNDADASTLICTCPNGSAAGVYVGLDVTFWAPGYLIEVVSTPYYSPTIGKVLSSQKNGQGSGANDNHVASPQSFYNTHFMRYPLLDILGLLRDFKCLERGKVDYEMLSEVVPWKNDGLLASQMSPDSYLFANPIADASCIPEAASAQIDYLLTSLWWCMGSWGKVYPLSNHVGMTDLTTAAATLAGKTVFEGSRDALLLDHATNICKPVTKSNWDQTHFKYQVARPSVKAKAFVTGKSALFWGSNVNPPYKSGNNASDQYMFLLYQSYHCCEQIKSDSSN